MGTNTRFFFNKNVIKTELKSKYLKLKNQSRNVESIWRMFSTDFRLTKRYNTISSKLKSII